MKNRDALSPAPTPGAVLAVYKLPFPFSSVEQRLYLAKVERVTPSGQILLTGHRDRYDASGRAIGAMGTAGIHVRWPTEADRADWQRQVRVRELARVDWAKASDETLEAAAKLLGIDVRDP